MTDERALNAAIETVRNRNIATLELAIKVGIEAYLAALAHPAPATVEMLTEAAKAGWNACRKSIYAVCEDVISENERHREDTENPPRHHFGRGGMTAAKSGSEDGGAVMGAAAALAAAISLLERTPKAKKSAPSDRMFDQMLADYRKALSDLRAALAPATEGRKPDVD